MKQIILELNLLDIFFIIAALVSLGFNIVQHVGKRKSIGPLKSQMIGLFNDIKAKSQYAYQTQKTIFSPNNPHKDIKTLQWEYAAFTQTMISNFQGFQENVVGLLVSINPSDKEGNEAFRAANYGLTDEEKELRHQYKTKLAQQQKVGIQQQESKLQKTSPDVDTDTTKVKEKQL
jgi:hypothetical protein